MPRKSTFKQGAARKKTAAKRKAPSGLGRAFFLVFPHHSFYPSPDNSSTRLKLERAIKRDDAPAVTKILSAHPDLVQKTSPEQERLQIEKNITALSFAEVAFLQKKKNTAKAMMPWIVKNHALSQKLMALCIWNRSDDGLKTLLEGGLSANLPLAERSPLIYAIEQRSISAVKLLLEYKADVSVPDRSGNSPIMLAARTCFIIEKEILELLLDAGADPDAQNSQGRKLSPVMAALAQGYYYNADLLLERGAVLDREDINFQGALKRKDQFSKIWQDRLQALADQTDEEHYQTQSDIFLMRMKKGLVSPLKIRKPPKIRA